METIKGVLLFIGFVSALVLGMGAIYWLFARSDYQPSQWPGSED
jgi:hypothetical protein